MIGAAAAVVIMRAADRFAVPSGSADRLLTYQLVLLAAIVAIALFWIVCEAVATWRARRRDRRQG